MQNSAYNIVSESVVLTEDFGNAALAGIGGGLAIGGVWKIVAATKARKCYKALKTVQSKEEAISVLNSFYSNLKLDAAKLNDPKEVTLWKRLWSMRATMYSLLNVEDEPGEDWNWKEALLHHFKQMYIACFVSGATEVAVGGLGLGVGIRGIK